MQGITKQVEFLKAKWVGASKEVFIQKFEEYNSNFNRYDESIGEIATKIYLSANFIQATDN